MKRATLSISLLIGCMLIENHRKVYAQDEPPYPAEAQLASFEDLSYPALARVTRIQGLVVVKATLDDKGNVSAVSPLTGPKPLLADSLANAKKWKFKPNTQKTVVISYEFRIGGACHDASHSLFQLVHPNLASITACDAVISG